MFNSLLCGQTSFSFTFPLSGQWEEYVEACVLLIGLGDWSKGLPSLKYYLLRLGKPSNYWSVTTWHKREEKTCWSGYARVEAGKGEDWAREIHHLSDSQSCAVPSWQRHPDCGQRLPRRGEVSHVMKESAWAILLGQVRLIVRLEWLLAPQRSAPPAHLWTQITHPEDY